MSDTYDVLTLTESRIAIGLSSTDTSQDTRLPQYVTAISRRLDIICGPIVQRTASEVIDGGDWWVDLRYWPVVSVQTVSEYAGSSATTLTQETLGTTPTNAYLIAPWRDYYEGRIYRRSGGIDARFPIGRRNVSVTYTAGRYTNTAAVDAKFKQAASVVLSNIFRKEQRPVNPAFAGPEVMGDLTNGLPGYLLPYYAEELLVDEIIPNSA